MCKRYERILKLAPDRPTRRLHLVHSGHVELERYGHHEPTFARLEAWGWLERHTPVHFLDAYDGYRPTRAGQKYLLYEEQHHLLMLRKRYVEEVRAKARDELSIATEAAIVSFRYELELANRRGFTQADDAPELVGQQAAIARFEARGYMTLDRFMTMYKLSSDALIVCGVLRYLDHRAPDKIANIDVGPKARHCLMCSTRWQTFFVRPGMAEELRALFAVEVRWV